MPFCITRGTQVKIILSGMENSAVKIAAGNLKNDLDRVFYISAEILEEEPQAELGAVAGANAGGEGSTVTIVLHTADGTLEKEKLLPQREGEPRDSVALTGDTDVAAGSRKIHFRREAYALNVEGNILYILGADRRGTIYGIYDLCERIGVSPWRFFAEVADRETEQFVLPEGYLFTDYPSVEYRGVFINDEEELEKWVKLHMGEDTIGVKTYEKIFELILRLKGNYIWPAMHVNSFNVKKENGALADRMGIVVGTSHCDMLMRSNNREWRPWIERKGYTDVEYDYSIPGRNREILDEYWRESVEQNKDFEVSYTLGMRGIHDSGFETKTLKGLTGKELLDAKIDLLETVIGAQERILDEVLCPEWKTGKKEDRAENKTEALCQEEKAEKAQQEENGGNPAETEAIPMQEQRTVGKAKDRQLKIFVPYKEVLELYDNGLKVPEDLTLIWANDNYGHIRRYPGEKEKKRKGGNGIYYHNSYWAPPGLSYLFTKSIPVSQTKNELKKAWNEGIRKLWVLNIGALKPLEIEISFYLRYAWEIGKDAEYAEKTGYLTQDVRKCLAAFFDGMFTDVRTLRDIGSLESNPCSGSMGNSGKEQAGRDRATEEDEEKNSQGKDIADLYIRWAQLTNVRKVEQLDSDAFSQYAYGNEASERMLGLQELKETADQIYERLPEREKDAFFQIVLWRIHASYISNAMYYYADRSAYCNKNGMYQAAEVYAKRSIFYDEMRRKLLYYYGNVQAEGRWSGIVTPEDFPPPRTAMYPAYVFPLKVGDAHLIVKAFGDEDMLTLMDRRQKWITLFSGGEGVLSCRIKAPEYVEVTDPDDIRVSDRGEGEVRTEVGFEKRILVQVKKDAPADLYETNGKIVVSCDTTGEVFDVPLHVDLRYENEKKAGNHIEEDGMVCCEAVDILSPGIDAAGLIKEQTSASDGITAAGEMIAGDDPEKANDHMDTGWFRIPYLGRGYGDLMESLEPGKELRYRFRLLSKGEHLLELHRFPSLNSVGDIQAYVKVDDGEKMLLKTEANDEKRGTWKNNVRDSVDRLYLRLPELSEGEHILSFISDSKYFAFSRWVIYTKERKENMLGMRSTAPILFGGDAGAGSAAESEHFLYEDCPLTRRPAIFARFGAGADTLKDEDMYLFADRDGNFTITEPKEAEEGAAGQNSRDISGENGSGRIIREILESGRKIFGEEDGQVTIDAASALAQTEFAKTLNAVWDYCGGFSYNGRGLAMHIRRTDLSFNGEAGAEIPKLSYKVRTEGGEYSVWVLLKYNGYDHASLKITLDGEEIPDSGINKKALRKYSAEQVYRFVQLCRINLSKGEHTLTVGICHSDIRIDRICLVRGEELPRWHSYL